MNPYRERHLRRTYEVELASFPELATGGLDG
jgi:hypothetical protein